MGKRLIMRARWVLYDIANGIHSGLPLCCVFSYSVLDRHGMYWTDRPMDDIQYVQCARCYRTGHGRKLKLNGMCAEWLIPPMTPRPWQGVYDDE